MALLDKMIKNLLLYADCTIIRLNRRIIFCSQGKAGGFSLLFIYDRNRRFVPFI
jgi:hypothetical protein